MLPRPPVGGGVLLLRGRGGKWKGVEREVEGRRDGVREGQGVPPLYLTSGYGPECVTIRHFNIRINMSISADNRDACNPRFV